MCDRVGRQYPNNRTSFYYVFKLVSKWGYSTLPKVCELLKNVNAYYYNKGVKLYSIICACTDICSLYF